MARKLKSYRLEDDLLTRVGVYAKSRGASETSVVEAALEGFLALAGGGVPDLPADPKPTAAVKLAPKPVPTVLRASSLAARQRANPAGMDRQARIEKQRGA